MEITLAESGPYLRREIARKLIHFTGLAVPVIYFFTSKRVAIEVLALLTATSITIDLARRHHSKTSNVFNKIFVSILRTGEREQTSRRLNAVSWFFIAATISAIVFPKYLTIVSITVSLFGDAASALIGMKFGSRRFKGKSLEGSAAFFIVALIVMLLIPKLGYYKGEYVIGAAGVLAGTLSEFVTTDFVDDNFTVPLSIAFTMWILYTFAFPQLDMRFGA